MKRTLTILGIGILSGWYSNVAFRASEPSIPQPLPQTACGPSPVTSALPRIAASPLPAPLTETLPLSQAMAIPALPTAPLARDPNSPPGEPDRVDGLVLSEDSVTQMEQERSHLPNYAYAVQTTEGWRIHLTDDDSVFGRAGIHTNEVITHESLRIQMQNPERARLAQRFMEILKVIER